jgi:hypothetical protein
MKSFQFEEFFVQCLFVDIDGDCLQTKKSKSKANLSRFSKAKNRKKTLMANIFPVGLCLTFFTKPHAPLPRISWRSSRSWRELMKDVRSPFTRSPLTPISRFPRRIENPVSLKIQDFTAKHKNTEQNETQDFAVKCFFKNKTALKQKKERSDKVDWNHFQQQKDKWEEEKCTYW